MCENHALELIEMIRLALHVLTHLCCRAAILGSRQCSGGLFRYRIVLLAHACASDGPDMDREDSGEHNGGSPVCCWEYMRQQVAVRERAAARY